MKVAPSYISKENLLKKLEKRNLKRIEKYTTVSNAFKPEDEQFIKNNIDTIARIAERNNCHLEFVPGADVFKKNAHMNVYKKGYEMYENEWGEPQAAASKIFSGQVNLPENIKDKKSFIKIIKSGIQDIFNNNKNKN